MLWLHDWIQRQSVKLLSNPKCTSPSTFKGRPLRKLKIGDDIHCKSPAGSSGLPFIELRPDEDQVNNIKCNQFEQVGKYLLL